MIVGVAGPYAAGKSEVVEFLRGRGFEAHSLSDVIRDLLSERGQSETRERMIATGRALRAEYGPAVLAERLVARFREDANYVIDSIRHPAEVEALRARATVFALLWVDAPMSLRFDRLRERARPGDPHDEEALHVLENSERAGDDPGGQQLDAVAAMADERLWNVGDLDALRRELEKALSRHVS